MAQPQLITGPTGGCGGSTHFSDSHSFDMGSIVHSSQVSQLPESAQA